jgi:flagellar hook-associated protein 1 FlgK
MSLYGALSIAMTGLSASQRALSVTAHNVANANTEGYTRKVADQEAVLVAGRGSGARALDPQRVVDEFLNAELRDQRSRLGQSDAVVRYHERLQETVFGAPGDGNRGIANRVSRLATAAEALAVTPEKSALKVAFIGAAQDLVGQIADDAARIQGLRADVDKEIAQTVDAINGDVRALYELNVQIARSQTSTELLDRRDRILQGLAEKIPISISSQENGTVAIYTSGGQALLEYSPSQLDYEPAAQVSAGTMFGSIRLFRASEVDPVSGAPLSGAAGTVLVTAGVRAVLTPELQADGVADASQTVSSPLTGGALQGLLQMRDRVLPELADQLGELAGIVRYTLNAAHNDAVPSPPPARLVGTRTDFADWGAGTSSGQAYLAVVDRATGATVATVTVDAAAPSPAAVAAQIDAGLGGLGSAVLNAAGALEIALGNPAYGLTLSEGDSRITVGDVAGHERAYGLAHYFGLNDLIVASGSNPTALAVRSDIAGDSARLSAIALAVETGPPVSARAGGAGDNRPAKALAAALQQSVSTISRGQMAGGQASVGAYAAGVVELSAVGAEHAKNTEATDRAIVEDLAFRQGSVSGVSLDEELSKLVLYQQAYTVSARIVSITNELFDDLLSTGR